MPKLLCIDDEEGVRDMMRGHFEPRGFEVFTADDGLPGIELCRQVNPDIILIDYRLKQMDGDTTVPHLRALVPRAKIFMVSAYPKETLAKRVAGLGLDGYFEKPISIRDLESAVRQALERP